MPTYKYGSSRISDGNGPEGSIAVNGIPLPLYLAFSFNAKTRTISNQEYIPHKIRNCLFKSSKLEYLSMFMVEPPHH